MAAVQTVEQPTFESVWALLQENAQGMKELRESQRETDRQMKKNAEEWEKRQKETNQQISRLGNRIGELIEHFAASNLIEKFEELGFEFTIISRNHIIKNKCKEHQAELDSRRATSLSSGVNSLPAVYLTIAIIYPVITEYFQSVGKKNAMLPYIISLFFYVPFEYHYNNHSLI